MVKILFGFLFAVQAHAFTLSEVGFDGGWPGKTVAFYYNSSNCPASVPAALNKAIDLWNSVPSSYLKLKLAGTATTTPAELVGNTATTVPVIVCDPNFQTTSGGADPDSVGGFGFFNQSGGKIVYGGLVLNVQSGKRNNINNYTATSLAILMAHEMGHVLGLGHSEFQPALMYYDIGSKKNLTLSQDDIDGMTYLYPRNELEDGLYGCGRASALPPATGAAALICLLIPLCWLVLLRRRTAARHATA